MKDKVFGVMQRVGSSFMRRSAKGTDEKGSQIVKEENKNNFEGIENGGNEMKSGKDIMIYSPVKGRAVELEAVGDGVFSSRMLGDGIAVEPAVGRVVAPVSGTVTMVFETKHAIGIISDCGVEILIHIGIDTVELNGKYFTAYVKNGDQVNTGDLLVEFDMDSIIQEGYSVINLVVITNTTDYQAVKPVTSGPVEEIEELIKISK